jgi:predicted transcriptional regulator
MDQRVMAPPSAEAQMIEPQVVRQLRQLQARGWGTKRIARELGLARNTIRRYLRDDVAPVRQQRPAARALDDDTRRLAVALFDGEAEGNAVVVAELL